MNDVPALSRGLRLLEQVAGAAAPPSFSDLWRWSRLPKATVARLLACLRQGGWIDAEAGYRLGRRAALLAPGADADTRLRLNAEQAAAALAATLGLSAIVHRFDHQGFTVLASVAVEDGIRLKEAGQRIVDLGRGPWGTLAYLSRDLPGRERALAGMTDATAFRRRIGADEITLARDGCLTDEGPVKPGVTRIACPFLSHDGAIIGSIGVGAVTAALPKDRRRIHAALRSAAADFAAHLQPIDGSTP